LELIQEKCGISFGEGKVVKLRELSAAVEIPPEVEKMAKENPELTREQRIEAIAKSDWAQGYARGVCRWVTGEATPECVDRLSRQLAEKVVGPP